MKILVTGAQGFVGRNLIENLKTIRDGKNRTRPALYIEEIFEYSRDSSAQDLDRFCANCDFVFHLAGVNRPQDPSEFQIDNVNLVKELLRTLEKHNNVCPIMLSSSIQASLSGRFGISEYGLSKRAGEDLLFEHAVQKGARVMIYRFPNIVGKWVKPNYNSAVGTFCYNIAHDLPIKINDPAVELELLFIEDLVEEMLDALEGKEHHCEFNGSEKILTSEGRFCAVPITYKKTLGYISECLYTFYDQSKTLVMPHIAPGSFEKKLYSMYLSYLPKEKVAFDYKMNLDSRGSFTELMKTVDHGQFSVNISKPGITKGQHWHNSKWELFIVVSGHALILERKIGTEEILEFEVSGDHIQAVHMLPGYTHSIINLSETQDLVTLMWANEIFDPKHPDTFYEPVEG